MRKFIILLLVLVFLSSPVSAAEITAPEVPKSGADLMPDETDTFWEGVAELIGNALPEIEPALTECLGICFSVFAVVLLVSVVQTLPGASGRSTELAGTVVIGTLLLGSANSLIGLGVDTVLELSEYGKLLLPVMTAALASSGGTTASAALYAGTTLFDSILSTVVSWLLVPMIYVYLCLAVASSALGEKALKTLSGFVKWLMTWCLKIVLYLFTGYMGMTGVISGSTDAAALKAAKLTISGMVPVVGNILSDASEAVLVGAGLVKNAAGIYGMLAVLTVWIRPFFQIGVHYLLLKTTAAVCAVFGSKSLTTLVQDFSSAMGLLLAMTSTGCLLMFVSLICFMKGVG